MPEGLESEDSKSIQPQQCLELAARLTKLASVVFGQRSDGILCAHFPLLQQRSPNEEK
jgi:hypothetical protein